MLERFDESFIARQPFVPPTVLCRELCGDEDFVDRCVESHPGETFGEGARILSEKLGPIRILKIPGPVRHTEVTEVHNWRDLQFMKRREGLVRETPVVACRPRVS